MLNTTILPGEYTLQTQNNRKLQAHILSCLFLSEQTPLLYAIVNGIRCMITPTDQHWILETESVQSSGRVVCTPTPTFRHNEELIIVNTALLFPLGEFPEIPNGIVFVECDSLSFAGLNYYYNDDNNNLVFRFSDNRRISLSRDNEFTEGDRVHAVRRLYWLPLV